MAQEETMYPPKTVISVSPAQIVLVRYKDQNGDETVQFALAGENNIILLDHRAIGIGQERTPMGFATSWLKEGILEKLKGVKVVQAMGM